MDHHDNPNQGKPRSNVFDLYGAKRRERRSDDGGAEEPGYYACGISISDALHGQEEWLRMHGEIEGQYSSIDMLRYADIVRVYCPVPELLCILCEQVIYTLEGRHLDVITVHIQDRMLRALYLFDPARYPEPGADEPVILSMERQELDEVDAVPEADAETSGRS